MPRVVVEPHAIPRLAPICVRCGAGDAPKRVAIGVAPSLPLPFAVGRVSFALCASCARAVAVKRASERAATFLLALVVLALVGLRFRPLLVPALVVLAFLPSAFARRFERKAVGVAAKKQLFDDRLALDVENPAVVARWRRA